MPKNYYIILGIPATSSQEDIKTAYRKLAKEYHPDRYAEGHIPFQNIQEAYTVLGNPASRKTYDDRRRQQRTGSSHRPRVEPLRSAPGPRVEPLVPEAGRQGAPAMYPDRWFASSQPFVDELAGRVLGNLDERGPGLGEDRQETALIVRLTPAQARYGGQVRIEVPVNIRCPGCRGSGGDGYYECWRCSGAGQLYGRYPIMIHHPPGIADGHTVRLSLDRLGLRGHFLSVTFLIGNLL